MLNIDWEVLNLESQSQVWLLFWILTLLLTEAPFDKHPVFKAVHVVTTANTLTYAIYATCICILYCFFTRGQIIYMKGGGGDFKPLIEFLFLSHWRLNIITVLGLQESIFFQITQPPRRNPMKVISQKDRIYIKFGSIWIYTCLHFTMWPFVQVWGQIALSGFSIKKHYYIAESASRQDEVNLVF